MNDSLQELYQEVIIDHSKNPRNFRVLQNSTHHAEGYNPLCGDQVELFLNVQDGIIKEVSFKGQGCAISTASASLMTETILGKTIQEALKLSQDFRNSLTEDLEIDLGKLEVLKGVKQYPMRVKCATMSWHTLKSALATQMEKLV